MPLWQALLRRFARGLRARGRRLAVARTALAADRARAIARPCAGSRRRSTSCATCRSRPTASRAGAPRASRRATRPGRLSAVLGWLRRRSDSRAPRDVDAATRAALLAVLDRDHDARRGSCSSRASSSTRRDVEPYLALARFYRMRGDIGRAIRLHQNLLLRRDLDRAQRIACLADLAARLPRRAASCSARSPPTRRCSSAIRSHVARAARAR